MKNGISEKQNREEWLILRRKGIGGSDIAGILGISPWQSPLDVWMDKTGRGDDKVETSAMKWGKILEDVVAREFAAETGYRVENLNRMIEHPGTPHFLANIDRLVSVDGKPAQVFGKIATDVLLECKTSNAFKVGEWGESGTDQVPEYYICQPMWYMAVTGAKLCHLAVLIGGNTFRRYEIKRDDEFIELIQRAADEFWSRNVMTDEPPPPDFSKDRKTLSKLYPGTNGETIKLPARAVEIKSSLDDIKDEIKRLEQQKEELTTEIHAMMGESSIGVLPDGSGGYSRKIQIRNIKPKEAYSYSFVDVRFSKKLAA